MLEPQETGQPTFNAPNPAIGYGNFSATSAPTVDDDETLGYSINSVWFDTILGRFYKCVDASTGAAIWRELLSSFSPIGYTQVSSFPTNRLAGRSTSGTGELEAIQIGSGLSLSGGVLSTTGGGLSIGAAVSGGGANRVLHQDGSQNLAASSLMLFTGSELQIKDTANIVLNKNLASDTQGILDLQVVGNSRIKFNPYDAGTGSRATFNASPFIFENVHATGQFIFNSLGSYIFRENGNSWFYLTNSQRCGINTSSPDAKLHVINTTEQFRFGYDASNYGNITVSSAGAVTFDAVGSGAKFVFADDVELDSGKTLKVGGTQFRGYTTSTGAVSTTELPNDKDWCFHYDSGAVERWLAINLGGKVYGVQLTEI